MTKKPLHPATALLSDTHVIFHNNHVAGIYIGDKVKALEIMLKAQRRDYHRQKDKDLFNQYHLNHTWHIKTTVSRLELSKPTLLKIRQARSKATKFKAFLLQSGKTALKMIITSKLKRR